MWWTNIATGKIEKFSLPSQWSFLGIWQLFGYFFCDYIIAQSYAKPLKIGIPSKPFRNRGLGASSSPRQSGLHKEAIHVCADFDEPLPDDFWANGERALNFLLTPKLVSAILHPQKSDFLSPHHHLAFNMKRVVLNIRNNSKLLVSLFTFLFCVGAYMEAEAVRPPLKPLNSKNFHEMIADAEVVAIGTVASVTMSKTLEPPLETVTIHVNMKPDKILKGSKTVEAIEIEESYRRFSAVDTEIVPEGGHATGKGVTAHIAGPAPPVGRYPDDSRVLVFLKSIEGSKQFRPLGSGSHDAYLGVFQITSDGVKSDRYRFDEVLSGHARSEAGFMDLIISIIGGKK